LISKEKNVDSKTNRTASRISSFGILQEVEIKFHLLVTLVMAKSIGIFVNNETTSREMRENSSSMCIC